VSASHDREAFLEHLRAVHFWLVVTALGLMILSSLPRSAQFQAAYDQASELTAVDPELTEDVVRRAVAKFDLPAKDTFRVLGLDERILWQAPDGTICELQSAGYTEQRPAVWVAVGGEAFALPHKMPTFFNIPAGERTFRDIKAIWDFLYAGRDAVIVSSVDLPAASNPNVLDGWHALYANTRIKTRGDLCAAHNNAMITTISGIPGERFYGTVIGTLVYPKNRAEWARINAIPNYSASGRDLVLPVDARVAPAPIPLLKSVLELARVHGGAGLSTDARPFTEVFRDLSEVSKGLEGLKLTDLRVHVGELAKQRGTDIEVLGAKLPVDVLRGWGPSLLLIVQVYFVLHLRIFRRRHSWQANSETFPWIALYPDAYSRGVTMLSCVIAPVATVVLILSADPGAASTSLKIFFTIEVISSIGLATGTAVFLWHLSRVTVKTG
jgi:hypothetical protein